MRGAQETGPPVLEADPEGLDGLLASERQRLVVLYLWRPSCPNCDFFAARLPCLLEALGSAPVVVVKMNADAHPETARRYGVYGLPHFVLFTAGRRIGKMSEFRGDEFWLSVIREHLPAPAD